MEPLAPTVEYYVPGLQFHAAPKHRRVWARRKPYKYQRRHQRNIGDFGKGVTVRLASAERMKLKIVDGRRATLHPSL
jgi:hypothetical protein